MKITKILVLLCFLLPGFPAQAEADDTSDPAATPAADNHGCGDGMMCATWKKPAPGEKCKFCIPSKKAATDFADSLNGGKPMNTDALKDAFAKAREESKKHRGEIAGDARAAAEAQLRKKLLLKSAAAKGCHVAGASFVYEGDDQMAIFWGGEYHTIRKASDTCTTVSDVKAFKKDANFPGDDKFFSGAKGCFDLLAQIQAKGPAKAAATDEDQGKANAVGGADPERDTDSKDDEPKAGNAE